MAILTEKLGAGAFIVSECCDGSSLSRDEGTLISGQNLAAGTVVGQITASKKYTLHDAAASDGSQSAIAVLFDAVDASAGDQKAVFVTRLAEVNGAEIIWKSGISGPNLAAGIASLATKNIIVR